MPYRLQTLDWNPSNHAALKDALQDSAYKPQPAVFMKHFPGPDASRADYREWNHAAMRDLYACIATETCGVNQEKVGGQRSWDEREGCEADQRIWDVVFSDTGGIVSRRLV